MSDFPPASTPVPDARPDPVADGQGTTADTKAQPAALRFPHHENALSTADEIGVMGDLHGDLGHALQVLRIFAERDVRVILQLGDFGVIWPGRQNWQVDVNKLDRTLTRYEQTFYFIDGNHDWHPRLAKFPLSADGLRWVTRNIAYIPRGYRTPIGQRFILAALGGANSIDRAHRTNGKEWWPAEAITQANLNTLGPDLVDVLIGHEVPLHVPTLDQALELNDEGWNAASRPLQPRAEPCFTEPSCKSIRGSPSEATTTGISIKWWSMRRNQSRSGTVLSFST